MTFVLNIKKCHQCLTWNKTIHRIRSAEKRDNKGKGRVEIGLVRKEYFFDSTCRKYSEAVLEKTEDSMV